MKFKFLIPLFVTLFVIVVFHYTKFFAVKFYPVAANLTVFMLFSHRFLQKKPLFKKLLKLSKADWMILREFTPAD